MPIPRPRYIPTKERVTRNKVENAWIREMCRKANISGLTLAALVGVHRKTVYDWFYGRCTPAKHVLPKLRRLEKRIERGYVKVSIPTQTQRIDEEDEDIEAWDE